MVNYPDFNDSFARLLRSGWTVCDMAFLIGGRFVWMVSGSNGKKQIRAEGATKAEAWWQAVEQARAVGMLRGADATSSES
jgi:hypothetical protein